MSIRSLIQFGLFVVYIISFFTVPLALLWAWNGAAIGFLLGLGFLFWVGFKGTAHIKRQLGCRYLSAAEAPELHNWLKEYCRRLNLPLPKIATVDSPSSNLAVFGFSKPNATLLITRGARRVLRPKELRALMARELSQIQSGWVFCESWLARFLSILDPWAVVQNHAHIAVVRQYPFRLFVRQIFLYPLTLLPTVLLRSPKDPGGIDFRGVKTCGDAKALAEGMRAVEAMRERHPFNVPFSTRHLFLVPPPTEDPLARIFFEDVSISSRISQLEALHHVVALG